MYLARFYRRQGNNWNYVFSKHYNNIGDIKEVALQYKLQAEVFDDEFEKLRVFTPGK